MTPKYYSTTAIFVITALCYYNRLLIGINLNFDTILAYKWSFFRERYAPFVFHLECFVKCKIGLKESKAEFMQS